MYDPPQYHRAMGLKGVSTIDAAAVDGVELHWAVRPGTAPGSSDRLDQLVTIVKSCLAAAPEDRPTSSQLQDALRDILDRERAMVLATRSH